VGEPRTEPFLKCPPVHIDETRRAIVERVRKAERELHDLEVALRECGDDVDAARMGLVGDALTKAKDEMVRKPR
jgi:hypothetical protein